MATRAVVIANFLNAHTRQDLAALYNLKMECQVNVAQDEGQPVEGEFKGRKWRAWSDGSQTWKSFRIPYNAATNPEYTDVEVKFDFAKHVEAIGMTGWDWVEKVSRWVAFDFDAITGHSELHSHKLTEEQLQEVLNVVQNISWVQARKSASGKGVHLYVFLKPVPTANHHEHAAVARSILAKMSALTGFDFNSKVDICGGNMWVWHRKMRGTAGFEIIKNNTECLEDIPTNWRDHVKVVKGVKKRVTPDFVEKSGEDLFDELSGQYTRVPLDEEHKKLLEYLKSKGDAVWWWDTERHMLVTHTVYLKEAYTDLSMRGIFDTVSTGKDRGSDHNCFLFPNRHGSWVVRRFSPGCTEHISWTQDKQGWTRCYLNKDPDLQTVARAFGGVELPNNGGYQFHEAEVAAQVASKLGAKIDIPVLAGTREAILKEQKDGRIIIELEADKNDNAKALLGWARVKTKWKRVFDAPKHTSEMETPTCDDVIRHVVTEIERTNAGWFINVEGHWQKEPLEHVRPVLANLGHPTDMLQPIIGLCVQRSWREVNKPFQPEYIGNRDWNRRGAQLKYVPNPDAENLKYPTWLKILNHLGASLDEAVKQNEWAKDNAILKGSDYIKCWIASLIQKPFAPLPYLFFFGPQDCGKSVFHEALELLFTRGVVMADHSLVSQSGFNGELANAVLCVIEETDLSKAKFAYNRVKDWVTGRTIQIHEKGKTPYQIPNSTHWVQCANDHTYCPTFSGDTRITVIRVDPIPPMKLIPKMHLIELLVKEAPDFLGALTALELPNPVSRLSIPIIATVEKLNIENNNQSLIEKFIEEKCHYVPGKFIHFSEVHLKFIEWLPQEIRHEWGKIRFGREFPSQFPKGNYTDNQVCIGNISWEPAVPEDNERRPFVLTTKGQLRMSL